jgi:hypothetical protein
LPCPQVFYRERRGKSVTEAPLSWKGRLVVLEMFGHPSDFRGHDRARLRRVEEKLDLVLQHLGIEFVDEAGLPPAARALADAGDKIGAIKALREETEMGLRAAKDAVEEYMAGR